ncbi:unnamed protein product, partial [Rangifer tarandus platyrhynchus]
IILANTYHLLAYPGPDVVERLGRLQQFTGWRGPMLTDSGGYQVFSLLHGRKLLHGDLILLTPEKAIEAQYQLGADLIVALDECTPSHAGKVGGTVRVAFGLMQGHGNAAQRAHDRMRLKPPLQGLYGVVQGGVYTDLRRESAAFVNEHDFFGAAIGGSLGTDRQQMHAVVAETAAMLRNDRPIHLLGVGGMVDIFHGVKQGIDSFDCVHPTRAGRHGSALVPRAFWDDTRSSGLADAA